MFSEIALRAEYDAAAFLFFGVAQLDQPVDLLYVSFLGGIIRGLL